MKALPTRYDFATFSKNRMKRTSQSGQPGQDTPHFRKNPSAILEIDIDLLERLRTISIWEKREFRDRRAGE
jgi:hypothetical protein